MMPAISMIVLPIMNATKPARNAVFAFFAKRDQLHACVPREANVPTIAVIAVATLISAVGTACVTAANPPFACAARMGM